MQHHTVHEPDAQVMPAEEVWNDAQQLAEVLRKNILCAERESGRTNSGDYTKDQDEWQDEYTVDTLAEAIQTFSRQQA